ncbi:multiple monosaccharide ABC transporter substrate-binding protein [Clostridium sp. D46t1_190503_E9]|uniref:multiple monosaccharide ABC transporter substrate-binding protein n=1 Tax=Clostridium sp. D46t1_190503_E9 TaxID=2787137 RepID=UPI00189B072B|nr:multiple monosaccharide ABC transporter substrate-binding protein [Clostridium sp. D46t1_190503_E9]
MKKLLSSVLALTMSLTLMSCKSNTNENSSANSKNKTIGIALPTKSSQRWIDDGNNMKEKFEELGYKVDMQYAEDVVENQVSQIENMITKGVDVLVIASIDGEALFDVINKAAEQKIPVIAYDRLIRGSENISYYATFDNFKVGVLQGNYIIEKLGLDKGEKGPFNIELFGGSPDDNNAYFFYDGAISVLKPYIDSKVLVVKSGQMGMDKVSTLRWDGATAQSRMDNLLSTYYSSEEIDAVLSPYDGISIGVLSSLKSVGYGNGDKKLPIVTGQDAEIPSIKSIISEEQTQTVFKDTRVLAEKTVAIVEAVLEGKEAPVNDTKTYDNGKKIVPSYLCEPVSVDINNYKEALIDSGYYTEEQLK